jgi:hypothetical protein
MSNEADGLRQAVKLLQKELGKAKKHIISLENEVD